MPKLQIENSQNVKILTGTEAENLSNPKFIAPKAEPKII